MIFFNQGMFLLGSNHFLNNTILIIIVAGCEENMKFMYSNCGLKQFQCKWSSHLHPTLSSSKRKTWMELKAWPLWCWCSALPVKLSVDSGQVYIYIYIYILVMQCFWVIFHGYTTRKCCTTILYHATENIVASIINAKYAQTWMVLKWLPNVHPVDSIFKPFQTI